MSLLSHEVLGTRVTCSALTDRVLKCETIQEYAKTARDQGAFDSARATQGLAWMRQLIHELLRNNFRVTQRSKKPCRR